MSDETTFQPQIKITWLLGTLAAFAIFAVIASYSARMTRDYTDYDKQRAQDRYLTLDKLQQEATATLTSADWVDQDKKIVRIPIDEAMVKEIDTLKSKSPQIGNEIPAPAPAAAPAAAKPATPPAAGAAPSTNAAPAAAAPPATTNK